jgi:dTDP-4-dehydrorhamnose reductase
MKILLTGKNGQVGFELQRSLAPLGQVTAVGSQECDLAQPDAIRALVRRVQPDLIINPAAYTAVDKAESEPERAWAVNAQAPAILAEEAKRINAWIVHYSTDYVFDGTNAHPYTEDIPTNPLGAYGKSKRDGEIALQQSCEEHLIFRTSWVVGAHGNNFAKTILRLGIERETLRIVEDQFGAPTSAALLADVTAQIVGRAKREGSSTLPYGLYHLTASGVTSWHGFARFVLEEAQKQGIALKIHPGDVQAITTEEYPLPAKRPANSQLHTELFRSTFDLTLPPWQEGIHHILQQIL